MQKISPNKPATTFYGKNIHFRKKQLGFTFSNARTWSEHINLLTDIAWSRLNLLRVKIKLRALQNSILRLSDICWTIDALSRITTQLKNILESIRTEAARIITGATKLGNTKNFILS